MGRVGEDITMTGLRDIDREALGQVLADISTVAQVALLVEELRFAADRQASFVLDVSHDIRNPIQNIVFKAERLKSGFVETEDIPRQAKRIAVQVKRLHLLSERVWTLEALERGTLKLAKPVKLNVYDVLRECRDSLVDLAEVRSVTMSIDSALQAWPALPLDRRFFTQAMINVIDNAVKYSSPATEVRIDGREDADLWHIAVANRGIPIREDEYDRVFERFYRTLDAQQYVREGTGIGLFLVKRFADTYGRVRVNSQPISGTSDYVTEFVLSLRKE